MLETEKGKFLRCVSKNGSAMRPMMEAGGTPMKAALHRWDL
jgi:hypothetical protein